MRRDSSVICDSSKHEDLAALAIGFVVLWPVGMMLVFIYTLWFNRNTLLRGQQTQYSKSASESSAGLTPCNIGAFNRISD